MKKQSTPQFIVARTAEDLQEQMMLLQMRRQMFFHFYDIQQAKDGKWYAWFDMPLSRIRDEDGETTE